MIRDARRHADETVRRHRFIFRISARNPREGDPVPRPEFLHVAAHFAHHSAGFLAKNERRRRGITSLAEINVNVIDTRRGDLYERFIRLWLWSGKIYVGEDFHSSRFRDLHRLPHTPPAPPLVTPPAPL